MSRNHLNLIPSATRSIHTILEIADHVPGLQRDHAAHMVKGLFDLLAWSDGILDGEEIALLDRLCEEVPDFTELCEAHDIYEPTDPTFGEIPRLLIAVVEHDRHTGDRLAPILVAAMETIGYAIIGVSGAPVDIAKAELHLYIDGLRGISRQLTTAGSLAAMR